MFLLKTKINSHKKSSILKIFFLLIIFTASTILPMAFPLKINAITLQELSNQISALSNEEEALIEEIISVEAMIDVKINEIERLSQVILDIENELEDINLERSMLKESLNEKRDLMEQRIIYSYKYNRNSVVKMVMTARDINEFITVVYLLKNIMQQDAELLESIRLEKESYDRILRKSEEKKKELENTKSLKLQEQEKLEENHSKKNVLLEQVASEKIGVQQTLAAIRERITRIQPEGVTLTGEWKMVATAYYAGGGGINGNGITATGLRARKGLVAVDPKVIRLGTKLYIEGYGIAIAADTGGWIKGDRIDLCFETLEECYRYGRRKIYVYLVGG